MTHDYNHGNAILGTEKGKTSTFWVCMDMKAFYNGGRVQTLTVVRLLWNSQSLTEAKLWDHLYWRAERGFRARFLRNPLKHHYGRHHTFLYITYLHHQTQHSKINTQLDAGYVTVSLFTYRATKYRKVLKSIWNFLEMPYCVSHEKEIGCALLGCFKITLCVSLDMWIFSSFCISSF